MKKFGFIVDLSDSPQDKIDFIVEAFAIFSKDLTPKHFRSTHCRILTPAGSELLIKERMVIGPLDLQEFEESSWLTDWLYHLPTYKFNKWLNYAAMIGPGPILVNEITPEMNPKITIPCFSDNEINLAIALSDCLKAIYHDEGARKIFSKASRRILSEEIQKNKVTNTTRIL